MYDDRGNAMPPSKIAVGPSWQQKYLKPADRMKRAVKEVWPEPTKATDQNRRARSSQFESQSRRDRIIQLSRELRLTAFEIADDLNIPLDALYRELRKLLESGTLLKTMGHTENKVRVAFYSIAC